MRNKFDEQLEMLHTELIEMGALCEKAIDETLKVLMNGDTQTAQSIMKEDNAIDLKERDIESLCLKLLLQQQPVAGRSAEGICRTEDDHGYGADRRPGGRHCGDRSDNGKPEGSGPDRPDRRDGQGYHEDGHKQH